MADRTPIMKRGVAASPGIALGYVHFVERGRASAPHRAVAPPELEAEVARFDTALQLARGQLAGIKEKFSREEAGEHLYLIEAQEMMLADKSITDVTRELIRDQRINAEWALQKSLESFKQLFDRIDDEYFRDRRSDIEYVEERLLRALGGTADAQYVSLQKKTVVAAHRLSPVDIARMNREQMVGLVTDAGGKTSHTAIIAKSLGIPMVVGLTDITQSVRSGDKIIVDGSDGTVIVHPDSETWARYDERRRKFHTSTQEVLKNRFLRAETKDQYQVRLLANIDFLEEIPSVYSNGGEGVGMLRTEHLFLDGAIPVSEEEQYRQYKSVIDQMKGQETTIRLLDLAGDDLFGPPLAVAEVRSPALGLRGIRLLLAERELLRTQLRAILRASAHGKTSVLYPMVTCVDEVRQVNGFLEEMMEQLRKEGKAFDPELRIGAMIEVPGAALTADTIAREVDFLSVGTNDLLQYTLAVDRGNELVAELYNPLHRGHLRLLQMIVDQGHKAGIAVGVCGEMASEAYLAPIFLAMEFNFLSMNSGSVAPVKRVIREMTLIEAKEELNRIQGMDDPHRARMHLHSWHKERFPDSFA